MSTVALKVLLGASAVWPLRWLGVLPGRALVRSGGRVARLGESILECMADEAMLSADRVAAAAARIVAAGTGRLFAAWSTSLRFPERRTGAAKA